MSIKLRSHICPVPIPALLTIVMLSIPATPSMGSEAASSRAGRTAASPEIINFLMAAATVLPVSQSASYNTGAHSIKLTASVSSQGNPVSEGSAVFSILQGSSIVGVPVSGSVLNGVCSANYLLPAGMEIGSYTIEVDYSGSANFDPAGGSASLTVNPAPTIVFGQPVTLYYSKSVQHLSLTGTVVAAGALAVNEGALEFIILDKGLAVLPPASAPVINGNAVVGFELPGGFPANTYIVQINYNNGFHFASNSNNSSLQVLNFPANLALGDVTATFSNSSQILQLNAVLSGQTSSFQTVTFQVTDGTSVIGLPVVGTIFGNAAAASYELPASTPEGVYQIQATATGGPNIPNISGSAMLTVLPIQDITLSLDLPADGSCSASSTGTGPFFVGYADVVYSTFTGPGIVASFGTTSPANAQAVVGGSAEGAANGLLYSEASVLATTALSRTRVFIELNSQSDNNLAILNPSPDTPAIITADLTDTTGEILGSATLSLDPRQNMVLSVNQTLGPLPDAFLGTLMLSSSTPIAVTNLSSFSNERNELSYSTLPAADLDAPDNGASLIFPQMADGAGMVTRLMLMNPSSTDAIAGQIAFWDEAGNPLALQLAELVGARTHIIYALPPDGMISFSTTGTGDFQSGYITVATIAGPVPIGAATFIQQNPETLVTSQASVPSSSPSTLLRALVETRSTLVTRDTGIALVNRNDVPATLNLMLAGLDGSVEMQSLSLEANAHSAQLLTQIFPDLGSSDFQGVLTISSSVPVAALMLRMSLNDFGDVLYSNLPLLDMNAPPMGSLFLPLFVNGDGFQTQIQMIDSSEIGGTVYIRVYDQSGAPAQNILIKR